ncbi:MAG: hypothetical protein V3T77_02795 [Planctomycetota bacterium]
MRNVHFVRLWMPILVLTVMVCPLQADTINVMRVSDETTAPGSFASVKVLLSHDAPVQGFQTAMIYTTAVLTLDSVDHTGLDIDILILPESVEFFVTDSDPFISPGIGWAAGVVILDFSPPFNSQTIPVGSNQSIIAYNFQSVNDPGLIGTCTNVQLVNGLGSPPISNVITVDGLSVAPKLVPGTICFQALPVFKRGDANTDGIVDVADVIFVIQFLFVSGAVPDCQDSADGNNDQLLDVSDAIFLINFLFSSGAIPPAPGPTNCGTASGGGGSIGCQNYGAC